MVFTGTFASDDPDKKYLMIFWEFMDLFFWNTATAWRINTWFLQGLRVTLANRYFFLFFFWSTLDLSYQLRFYVLGASVSFSFDR